MKAKKLEWKTIGNRYFAVLDGRCDTFNIRPNYDGTFKVELTFKKIYCMTLEDAMATAQTEADWLVSVLSKKLHWVDRLNDPEWQKKWGRGGKTLFYVKQGKRVLFPIKQKSGDSWEINLGFSKKHIYNDVDVCMSAAQADANWLVSMLAEIPE